MLCYVDTDGCVYGPYIQTKEYYLQDLVVRGEVNCEDPDNCDPITTHIAVNRSDIVWIPLKKLAIIFMY